MCKIPNEIIKNKFRALAVLFIMIASPLLFFGSKLLIFAYVLIIVMTSLYVFWLHFASAGPGTKSGMRASIELTILILAAALFFFLRSITPEIFGVQISATDQAYFVISLCGYTFLYFIFFKKGGSVGGPWGKFLRTSYFIILIALPIIHYIDLIAFAL